jgi:uncharacterized cupin superfamily protein
MKDLGGGVFVTRVDADEWEHDEETGGLVHMLFDDGAASGGLWKLGPETGPVVSGLELPARETIVVLQGSARIEIQDGPTLELGPGDMATMPKGAVTTWHVSEDFKEIWLYS